MAMEMILIYALLALIALLAITAVIISGVVLSRVKSRSKQLLDAMSEQQKRDEQWAIDKAEAMIKAKEEAEAAQKAKEEADAQAKAEEIIVIPRVFLEQVEVEEEPEMPEGEYIKAQGFDSDEIVIISRDEQPAKAFAEETPVEVTAEEIASEETTEAKAEEIKEEVVRVEESAEVEKSAKTDAETGEPIIEISSEIPEETVLPDWLEKMVAGDNEKK